MEEAAELGNYLPLSYKSPKEQEYIEFLLDAFPVELRKLQAPFSSSRKPSFSLSEKDNEIVDIK
jgi:hypothetical protein